MTPKEIFFRDKEECAVPSTHIAEGITDPALRALDDLFGAADVLSIENAKLHRKALLALSAAGTLLTLAFLLYDEAEWHGLILACGAMILCLFLIRRMADKLECHRKYLEYRVLAESLRVQYYLFFAGIRKRVSGIQPWFIKKGIPWIGEVLAELPLPKGGEQQSVLDVWIRDQAAYHRNALARAEKEHRRDGQIARAVLLITIAAYFAALIFEFVVLKSGAGFANADRVRTLLKILLGTMSAVTLFTGSYYGKMSLENIIDDHKRMIALYEKAEEDIARDGENRKLLLALAREFLNENSAWYSYQNKNRPDLVF